MKKLFFKGKSYEMKPHTMSIARKEDDLKRVTSQEEACIKLFDYARAVLGDENVEEMLGTIDVEEIDTKELEMLCNEIGNVYDYDVIKQQSDYANKLIAESKAVDKVIDAGKSAEIISKINKK